MKNFTAEETLKIMELVAEIAVAVAGNESATWDEGGLERLIRTLFPTMCELLEKVN